MEVSYLLYKDFYDGKVISNFYCTSTNFYPSRDQTYYSMHFTVKDVRAHCYCASLVRTLFIGHARATSFSSARTESKT